MSLINDALKKAQKQRTGESTPLAAMPGVGGESASRIARRDKPLGFNSLLLRLGLGGAVLVLVVGGWFVFRTPAVEPQVSLPGDRPGQTPGGQQPTTASPQVSAPTPVVAPPKTPEPVVTPPKTPDPRPKTPDPTTASAFTLPVVIPPPPTPEPVIARKPEPAATKPSQASGLKPKASSLAEPAKPAPPVKLEPRAITYIEGLRIAGIRASATDSKVLMSDRVYRVGDTVEHELGLKLIGITANSLTFEDEHGGRYTRQF